MSSFLYIYLLFLFIFISSISSNHNLSLHRTNPYIKFLSMEKTSFNPNEPLLLKTILANLQMESPTLDLTFFSTKASQFNNQSYINIYNSSSISSTVSSLSLSSTKSNNSTQISSLSLEFDLVDGYTEPIECQPKLLIENEDDPSLYSQEISLSNDIISFNIAQVAFFSALSLDSLYNYRFTISCDTISTYITLYANSPPSNGFFNVYPKEGEPFLTQFHFQSGNWIDPEGDLPFYINVLYYDLYNNTNYLSSAQDFYSILPLLKVNSSIVTIFSISDSLFAKTEISQEINLYTTKSLGEVRKDSFQFFQDNKQLINMNNDSNNFDILFISSSSIDMVDCTTVPDSFCLSLNRNPCGYRSHLCGPCLDKFEGDINDANTMCYSTDNLYFYDYPFQTGNYYFIESPLEIAQKSCPYNCNNRGNCTFYSENDYSQVSSCLLIDSTCNYFCECEEGYYGKFCEIIEEEKELIQKFRDDLIETLSISFQTLRTSRKNSIFSKTIINYTISILSKFFYSSSIVLSDDSLASLFYISKEILFDIKSIATFNSNKHQLQSIILIYDSIFKSFMKKNNKYFDVCLDFSTIISGSNPNQYISDTSINEEMINHPSINNLQSLGFNNFFDSFGFYGLSINSNSIYWVGNSIFVDHKMDVHHFTNLNSSIHFNKVSLNSTNSCENNMYNDMLCMDIKSSPGFTSNSSSFSVFTTPYLGSSSMTILDINSYIITSIASKFNNHQTLSHDNDRNLYLRILSNVYYINTIDLFYIDVFIPIFSNNSDDIYFENDHSSSHTSSSSSQSSLSTSSSSTSLLSSLFSPYYKNNFYKQDYVTEDLKTRISYVYVSDSIMKTYIINTECPLGSYSQIKWRCPYTEITGRHKCNGKKGKWVTRCPPSTLSCSILNQNSLWQNFIGINFANQIQNSNVTCNLVSFNATHAHCHCSNSIVDSDAFSIFSSASSSDYKSTNSSLDISLSLAITNIYTEQNYEQSFHQSPQFITVMFYSYNTIFASFLFTILLFHLFAFYYNKKNSIKTKEIEHKVAIASITRSPVLLFETVSNYITQLVPRIFLDNYLIDENDTDDNDENNEENEFYFKIYFNSIVLIIKETFKHHTFFNIFMEIFSFNKSLSLRFLVLILIMNHIAILFLLVLFYFFLLQKIYTCETSTTESNCINIFKGNDNSFGYCQWHGLKDIEYNDDILLEDNLSPGVCSYTLPSFNFWNVLITLTIITPFYSILNCFTFEIFNLCKSILENNSLASVQPINTNENVKVNPSISLRKIPGNVISAHNIAIPALNILKEARLRYLSEYRLICKRTRNSIFKSMTKVTNPIVLDPVIVPEQYKEIEKVFQDFYHQLILQRIPLKFSQLKFYDNSWNFQSNLGSKEAHIANSTKLVLLEIMEKQRKNTITYYDKLKDYPDMHCGIELIRLFILDLLGKNSPYAKIFNQKFNKEFPIVSPIKYQKKFILIFFLILITSGTNILVAYVSSFLNSNYHILLLEMIILLYFIIILVLETFTTFFLHIFVPLLAKKEVQKVYSILINLIKDLCIPSASNSKFFLDITEFLFLSSSLGKKLPDIPESLILGAYHAHLPGSYSWNWKKEKCYIKKSDLKKKLLKNLQSNSTSSNITTNTSISVSSLSSSYYSSSNKNKSLGSLLQLYTFSTIFYLIRSRIYYRVILRSFTFLSFRVQYFVLQIFQPLLIILIYYVFNFLFNNYIILFACLLMFSIALFLFLIINKYFMRINTDKRKISLSKIQQDNGNYNGKPNLVKALSTSSFSNFLLNSDSELSDDDKLDEDEENNNLSPNSNSVTSITDSRSSNEILLTDELLINDYNTKDEEISSPIPAASPILPSNFTTENYLKPFKPYRLDTIIEREESSLSKYSEEDEV